MASKKKHPRPRGEATPRDTPGAPPPRPPEKGLPVKGPSAPWDWAEIGRAYGLLLLSGVMVFLGFAGFGLWPLAFVAWVPALFVFDPPDPAIDGLGGRARPRPTAWALFRRAMFFGYLCYYGGFYWVVDTIVDFGGFPYPLALLFASIYYVFQGFQFVLVLTLFRRAREGGFSPTLAIVCAYLALELAFPMLFDHYYGTSFHGQPQLVQVADLGGPMLLTALAMVATGAVFELLRAGLRKQRLPRLAPALFAGYLLFCLGYSTYRIDEVEGRMATAETLDVGLVQSGMGIQDHHARPGEALRRHLAGAGALSSDGAQDGEAPDLVVWPESSLNFTLPRAIGAEVAPMVDRALDFYAYREPGLDSPGWPSVPMIFGGVSVRHVDGERRSHNTAFLTDRAGRVSGHYDKTYLLMWGEYIPFGNVFPILYEWSPNSGQFTPGDHTRPLTLRSADGREHRITTLVCYEDILPRFVRGAVREGNPHLLVNVTNDAWFGRTHEPYVHLALAKMRAVEHHRAMVRATQTGVSAIIDPLGRIVAETSIYEEATLRADVPLLTGATIYETVGDWPGWLALGGIVYMAFVSGPLRRRRARPGSDRQGN